MLVLLRQFLNDRKQQEQHNDSLKLDLMAVWPGAMLFSLPDLAGVCRVSIAANYLTQPSRFESLLFRQHKAAAAQRRVNTPPPPRYQLCMPPPLKYLRRCHPPARKPSSQAVLRRMQITFHEPRRTPHGASRLVPPMSGL